MCGVYYWFYLTLHLLFLKLSDQAGGHWGEWGPMSPCSVTCGPGSQQKVRVWIHDPADGAKTQDKWTSTQSFACTNEKYPNCPEDGKWTGWTGWSGCTRACGSGIRDRTRECYGQLYGGKNCEGENAQKEDCNQDPCPPLPKKFDMLQCKDEYNFTCQSKKMCVPGIQKCDGTVQCHDGSDEMNCPIFRGQQGYIYYDLRSRNEDGKWTGWTGWSGCTRACGSGIRDRTRECYGQLYGGKNCEGENAQKEDCNQDPCPPLPKKFDMLQCKDEYNFTCQSKKMCVPGIQKCDGTVQCHDGSDEMNCPIFRGQQGYIYYDLRSRNDGVSSHISSTGLFFGLVVIKFVCLFIT